jgi:hypothetical protein
MVMSTGSELEEPVTPEAPKIIGTVICRSVGTTVRG